MVNFEVLEPAVDPSNRISFLLDWELTLKCNLDCSYCKSGIDGSHDNSIPHPSVEDCLKTIDFMYEYADLYLSTKIKGIKYVMLNVYGGEALSHPHIVEILKACREKYQPYADRWYLTISTTTNGIVSKKRLKEIIPYIDEFTMSYHAEATEKQQKQFKENMLLLKESNKRQKCVVLMHHDSEYFQDGQEMTEWLKQHNIKLLPRALDNHVGDEKKYEKSQVVWFDKFYKEKTFNASMDLLESTEDTNLSNLARACCGGRQLCQDQNYKQRHFYVENKFTDWFCSVNHFFIFVRQITGDIFVNKDCKMNYNGSVGPIGSLNAPDVLLNQLREQIDNHAIPVIQCKKWKCICGLCAPKAKNLDTFNQIMGKYLKS